MHNSARSRQLGLLVLLILVFLHILFFSLLSFQKIDNFNPTPTFSKVGVFAYMFEHNVFKTGWVKDLYTGSKDYMPFFIFIFPFYLLLVLYYTIFPFAKALIFYNVFFMALAALPIFLISKLKFKGYILPLAFAVSYLISPIVSNITLYGFHPYIAAIPLLLFAFYYLEKNMPKRSFLFVVLSNMVNVDISLITCLWGLSLILSKKNKKFGKSVFLFSGLWILSLVVLFCLWIKLSGTAFPLATFYLEKYGNSFSQVLKTTFSHPGVIFQHFLNEDNLILLLFFLPLGFSSLFSPLFLIPILPILSFVIMHRAKTAIIIPVIAVIYLASIYGVAKILSISNAKLSRIKKEFVKKLVANIETFIAMIILLLSYITCYYLSDYLLSNTKSGSIPFSKNFDLNYYKTTPRSITGHKIYKLIPRDSSCLTLPSLFNYLFRQKNLGKFPEMLSETAPWDYIFLDMQQMDKHLLRQLKVILDENNYGIIVYRESWILLKRGYGTYRNKQVISDIIKGL